MTRDVVLAAVLAVVLLVVLAVGSAVGRGAERRRGRRGGLLELDTPAGRAAVRDDDWFAAAPFASPVPARPAIEVWKAPAQMVGNCGHTVYDQAHYVLRTRDGSVWCSPDCERLAAGGYTPFAGGGGDAA